MVTMTFEQYEKEMERFASMPDTTKQHGITLDEITKMENDPEKYLRYAMYLLTRDAYKEGGNNEFAFTNIDAVKPTSMAYRLDSLVEETINWVDETTA